MDKPVRPNLLYFMGGDYATRRDGAQPCGAGEEIMSSCGRAVASPRKRSNDIIICNAVMPNHDYAPIPRPLNFPWLACFFLALLLLIATTLSREASQD